MHLNGANYQNKTVESYLYERSQVSVYRTNGPLVVSFKKNPVKITKLCQPFENYTDKNKLYFICWLFFLLFNIYFRKHTSKQTYYT